MSPVRVLLTTLLALWLPLSCGCRLQAVQELIADTTGWIAAAHAACGHDHHDHAPGVPEHDCDCESHDQVLLRGGGIATDPAPQPPAPMPLPPVIASTLASAAPALARAGGRPPDPARVKAGSTLLRLHCALTI